MRSDEEVTGDLRQLINRIYHQQLRARIGEDSHGVRAWLEGLDPTTMVDHHPRQAHCVIANYCREALGVEGAMIGIAPHHRDFGLCIWDNKTAHPLCSLPEWVKGYIFSVLRSSEHKQGTAGHCLWILEDLIQKGKA